VDVVTRQTAMEGFRHKFPAPHDEGRALLEQVPSASELSTDSSAEGPDSPSIVAGAVSSAYNSNKGCVSGCGGSGCRSNKNGSRDNDESRLPHLPHIPKLRLTRRTEKVRIDDVEPRPFDEQKHDDDELPERVVSGFSLAPSSVEPATQPSIAAFDLVGRVIGATNLMELAACPCCQQCYDGSDLGTLNEPNIAACDRLQVAASAMRGRSIFGSHSHDEDDDDDDQIEVQEDVLPGVLAAGVRYSLKKVIVEGWLHKKGSGTDWMGSRSWKARWARLASARVDGYDIDVPLLIISWYPTSSAASTVVVLDSTIVLPVDLGDKSKWNSSRFEVRHIPKAGSNETPVTRTFAAPKKGRDAWVYSISQALLSYEKQKDKARKMASFQTVAASRRPTSRDMLLQRNDDVWTGERFVNTKVEHVGNNTRPTSPTVRPLSPPLSPHSRGHPGSLPLSPSIPRPNSRRPSAAGAPSSTRKNSRPVARCSSS